MIRREIIYPVFLECCQHTNDAYWESIFEDLAYGKPPYGTYISKGFLCCSYKKKEFSYKIEKKEAKIIFQEVHRLLTKKLGMLSHQEKVCQHQEVADMEEMVKNTRKTWKNIRKKNIKELFIELYVTRMRRKYSLTIKQARYLLSLIFIALIFKVITSKDIEYKNGKIENIQTINFSENKVSIKHDIYQTVESYPQKIVENNKLMSDNWKKYLKDLKKTVK